jgi:hypothetical protein
VLDICLHGRFIETGDRVREFFCERTGFDLSFADFDHLSVPYYNAAPADRFYDMFIFVLCHGVSVLFLSCYWFKRDCIHLPNLDPVSGPPGHVAVMLMSRLFAEITIKTKIGVLKRSLCGYPVIENDSTDHTDDEPGVPHISEPRQRHLPAGFPYD